MFRKISIDDAHLLPWWRRPITLLFLMALAMPIAFNTWSALLNNFVIELADFDGSDIGLLHTVREIPGFLAIGVIFLLLFIREQVLGLLSLALLGVATAVTAYFPTMGGILMITLLSSIGFHYYETVNQSLQLQWLDKKRAPKVLGWLVAAGSAATLLAYGIIVLGWKRYTWAYDVVYLAGGGITALIALYCFVAFPQFEGRTPQARKMVLKKRYWLYYAMQFMAGARRQIFVVFAGFMMVERFGFDVHEITALYLINLIANIVFAPFIQSLLHILDFRRATSCSVLSVPVSSKKKRTKEQKNKKKNEQKNKKTNKQKNKQTKERTNERTNKRTNKQTNKQTNGKTKTEWKETNERTNEQINKQVSKSTNKQVNKQANK